MEGEIGRASKPIMFKWFKERSIRILKIGAGYRFCVCQVREEDGNLGFYAVSFNDANRKFYGGDDALENLQGNWLMKLKVDADKVFSFDCSRHATFFLMSNKETKWISMDPENPDETGLLHFYQEEHPEKEINGKKVK